METLLLCIAFYWNSSHSKYEKCCPDLMSIAEYSAAILPEEGKPLGMFCRTTVLRFLC